MAETLFLVRHGRYSWSGPAPLTPEGIQDSESARDELVAKGLGGRALILSSDKPRALATAEIIAAGLEVPVVPSFRINQGGNDPKAVQNLDTWIQKALEESDTSIDDNQQLVVVAHAPLIAVAKGMSSEGSDKKIRNGEVFEYAVGSWTNPEYLDFYEEIAEHEIAKQIGSAEL